MADSQEGVYQAADPRFFADYMIFSGTLRYYVAHTLEQAFKNDPNDIQRRFYVLGLYKEHYAAYEDMGAVLQGFLRWKSGEIEYPIEAILRYKDDKVVLSNLFERRNIRSSQNLFESLSLSNWIPDNWNSVYPSIDLEKVLKIFCQYIFEDCQTSQKSHGIDAYNRLKHGLAVVLNGSYYVPELPDAPAVFIKSTTATSRHGLLSLAIDDNSLEQRIKSIEFIQSTMRTLVGLYMIYRYGEYVRKRWALDNVEKIFENPAFAGLKDFVGQLSAKGLAKF